MTDAWRPTAERAHRTARRPRVGMFVLNSVTYDRRVLREAASLVDAGLDVSICGIGDARQDRVVRERHPDGFEIIRIPLAGSVSLWRRTTPAAPLPSSDGPAASPRPAIGIGLAPQLRWIVNARRRWWSWGRAAIGEMGPADVYHGHDFTGLGVAVQARQRHGGRLVYDSHDLFLEAGANASRPRLVRHAIRSLEHQWYRRADLVVTVNQALADRLIAAYGPKPVAVVHNCVPRRSAAPGGGDLLRERAGIPGDVPVVLYHGGFTANRGLGRLIRAMLEPGLERAHLVMLGYGPMAEELERLAADDRYGARVHVLPPVPPDELDAHIATADVAAMVNQPASDNELLSTPNKLFESLGAGVPIVTSDFPMRRQIVLRNPGGPLGAVCDPTDVVDIGRALARVLNAPRAERQALRARCLAAARERWNWERESTTLVAAYERLLGHETVPVAAPLSDPLA